MQLKLWLMKHMQSLMVHYSVILANNQDLSKSNSSLYCFHVCSIIFQINTLDSFIIVKKPKYLFSALFEENNQNLLKNEGINSILCLESVETVPIKIKTGKTTYYNLIYHLDIFWMTALF